LGYGFDVVVLSRPETVKVFATDGQEMLFNTKITKNTK